eukprot:7273594-Alexandrium_andersonii.AAC.1
MSDVFPDAFGALLLDEERWVAGRFAYVKRAWGALQRLEVEAQKGDPHGPWCEQFLQAMIWPRMPWVREIFIGALE